eukprot:TRINITY_DN24146_c0_g1_i1.p1 TRINITY_DN24146_c0_g1~~TRINITY_DN24146_c0_g1_i1.p1  ORF type:complete len:711 (+),score=196.07 TRINITY_DN24146_c0_g1_i1:43-2133(+)
MAARLDVAAAAGLTSPPRVGAAQLTSPLRVPSASQRSLTLPSAPLPPPPPAASGVRLAAASASDRRARVAQRRRAAAASRQRRETQQAAAVTAPAVAAAAVSVAAVSSAADHWKASVLQDGMALAVAAAERRAAAAETAAAAASRLRRAESAAHDAATRDMRAALAAAAAEAAELRNRGLVADVEARRSAAAAAAAEASAELSSSLCEKLSGALEAAQAENRKLLAEVELLRHTLRERTQEGSPERGAEEASCQTDEPALDTAEHDQLAAAPDADADHRLHRVAVQDAEAHARGIVTEAEASEFGWIRTAMEVEASGLERIRWTEEAATLRLSKAAEVITELEARLKEFRKAPKVPDPPLTPARNSSSRGSSAPGGRRHGVAVSASSDTLDGSGLCTPSLVARDGQDHPRRASSTASLLSVGDADMRVPTGVPGCACIALEGSGASAPVVAQSWGAAKKAGVCSGDLIVKVSGPFGPADTPTSDSTAAAFSQLSDGQSVTLWLVSDATAVAAARRRASATAGAVPRRGSRRRSSSASSSVGSTHFLEPPRVVSYKVARLDVHQRQEWLKRLAVCGHSAHSDRFDAVLAWELMEESEGCRRQLGGTLSKADLTAKAIEQAAQQFCDAVGARAPAIDAAQLNEAAGGGTDAAAAAVRSVVLTAIFSPPAMRRRWLRAHAQALICGHMRQTLTAAPSFQ